MSNETFKIGEIAILVGDGELCDLNDIPYHIRETSHV